MIREVKTPGYQWRWKSQSKQQGDRQLRIDGRKCDGERYHKKLPADEQVRDIERKVGLAGSSLAPVVLGQCSTLILLQGARVIIAKSSIQRLFEEVNDELVTILRSLQSKISERECRRRHAFSVNVHLFSRQ